MTESATSSAGEPPVIELRNVSKSFGEVRALSGINFKVNRREIVGLLGDNGSGKSTLVKVVMGFHAPDSGGEIYFHGKRVGDWSVAKARSLGIETVYQERALAEKQPIWRNMFMGRELRTRLGLLDVERMRAEFGAADARAHGLYLGRRASQQCRGDDVGRREAGGRDHARPPF